MDNQQPLTNNPPVDPGATAPMAAQPPPAPSSEVPTPPSTPSETQQVPPAPPSTPPAQPNYVLFLAVGALVVIGIIAGLFIMGLQRETQKPQVPTTSTPAPTAVPTVTPTPSEMPEPTLSSSDEIDALERDINSSTIEGLDREQADINKEAERL